MSVRVCVVALVCMALTASPGVAQSVARVTLDSASADGQPAYGSASILLIPYIADSTMYRDTRQKQFFVIDPNGAVVHSFNRKIDGTELSLMFPPRGFDSAGNAFFTGMPRLTMSADLHARNTAVWQIMRANFQMQKHEDIARTESNAISRSGSMVDSRGQRHAMRTVNPLAPSDQWTVMADGTLAVLRARDYRAEFFDADGKKRVSVKLPYQKRRVSDDEKRRLIDSVRTLLDDASSATEFSPLRDMANFYPPFHNREPQSDADGNLWIATHAMSPADSTETMFDVVDSRGTLLQHVRVPRDRSIVGFGRGGIVYLKAKTGEQLWTLERVRVAN